MKFIYTIIIVLAFVFGGNPVFAQQIPVPTDTLPPFPKLYNAGFDVIITYEGAIIYGLVKEVGLTIVKYQRTDIPDGPIYTIPRSEVYAISYRNQVKEYLNSPVVPGVPNANTNPLTNNYNNYNNGYSRHPFLLTHGNVRIGLGFIRGYTKVDNANQYSTSGTFPPVIIAYDGLFTNVVRLGLQVAFGSHKFSQQQFDTYDSLQNNTSLKENIFSIMAYGKYSSPNAYANLRPYVIGGLGINSSNIHSSNEVHFLSDANQSLLVTSGNRSVGLGILARIGTDYYFNPKLGAFLDIGTGVALLQLGLVINVQ